MEVQIWFERTGEDGKRTRRRWDGSDGTPLDDLLRAHRDTLQAISDRCHASGRGVGGGDTKDWWFKFRLALLRAGHVCDVTFDSGPECELQVVVAVLDAESAAAQQTLNREATRLRTRVECLKYELAWARERLDAYERAVEGLSQKRDTP